MKKRVKWVDFIDEKPTKNGEYLIMACTRVRYSPITAIGVIVGVWKDGEWRIKKNLRVMKWSTNVGAIDRFPKFKEILWKENMKMEDREKND